MARMFTLDIVTPEKTLYSGEVSSVTCPGAQGSFGVWANHAPFLAALRGGVLTLREATGAEKRFALRGGFFEVSANHAILLADDGQSPDEIDPAAEREALRHARHALSHPLSENADPDQARAAAEYAEAKLKVAEHPV